MLISIIVPIYNTNVYFLQKCFDSILAQAFFDYEVLLIDSSNNTETITFLTNYIKNNGRFRIIKSDKGVSKQRNIGIDYASGDLIAFIDSDDYVSPCYLSSMVKCVEETESDIVFPKLIKHLYDGEEVVEETTLEREPIIDDINENNFFINTAKNGLVNPVKLYKRSIIGDTRFREDLAYGEDMMFNFELSKKGYKATYCKEAEYVFTAVKGVNSAKKRMTKESIRIVKVMYDLTKKYKRKTSKENLEGMIYQFNYVFEVFFYGCVKMHQTSFLLWMLKYRFYYLSKHFSLRNMFYYLFPYTFNLIKKVFGKKD